MFDLKSVLKDIGAKEKVERKEALVSIVEERLSWTEKDKTEVLATIALTKYQLYWLMWRLRVHLKSYENFEWSEMKDVLQSILVVLEQEWSKCQSTDVLSAKENTPCSPPTTVASASHENGSL